MSRKWIMRSGIRIVKATMNEKCVAPLLNPTLRILNAGLNVRGHRWSTDRFVRAIVLCVVCAWFFQLKFLHSARPPRSRCFPIVRLPFRIQMPVDNLISNPTTFREHRRYQKKQLSVAVDHRNSNRRFNILAFGQKREGTTTMCRLYIIRYRWRAKTWWTVVEWRHGTWPQPCDDTLRDGFRGKRCDFEADGESIFEQPSRSLRPIWTKDSGRMHGRIEKDG